MGNIPQRQNEEKLSSLAVTIVAARNLPPNLHLSQSTHLSCSFNFQKYTRQPLIGGTDPVFESNVTHRFFSTKLSEKEHKLYVSFYTEDTGTNTPSLIGVAVVPIDPTGVQTGGCIEKWHPIISTKSSLLASPLSRGSITFRKQSFVGSSMKQPLQRPISCSSPPAVIKKVSTSSSSAPVLIMAPAQAPAPALVPVPVSVPVPVPVVPNTSSVPTISRPQLALDSSKQTAVLLRIDYSHFPSRNDIRKERTKDIEEYYQFGKVLGQGGFSVVKQAEDKETGRKVAIKIIDVDKQKNNKNTPDQEEEEEEKGEVEVNSIEQEIEIMKMLKHPHIVEFYECFRTPNKVYVVMELVTGGELLDVVSAKGFLAPTEVAAILRQVLGAVVYMHSNGIVHRDLKLENLLVDDSHTIVKITDFGLSRNYFVSAPSKCVGSIEYVAPEVLLCDTYDNAVDIWSVGVIAFMLLSGYPPFDAPDGNEMEICEKICQGDYNIDTPEWKDIDETTKDFIRKTLVLNPTKRKSAKELLDHPWILSAVTTQPTPPTTTQKPSSISPPSNLMSPQSRDVVLRLSQLRAKSSRNIQDDKSSKF